MRSFRAEGGAAISYRVDFSNAPFANISFFGPDRKTILFHLSLRSETALAVCNSRPPEGWNEEQARPVRFAPGGTEVEIEFAPPAVAVRLDGTEVFAFADDFPGLDTIAFVNFGGGIDAESMVFAGAAAHAPRRGHGHLTLRGLMLEGWGFDPEAQTQRLTLDCPGLADPPVPTVFARPNVARDQGAPTEEIGVEAALPGRIWRGRDGTEEISLQLCANGIACGAPLVVDRGEVVRRIESLARSARPEDDAVAALLSVEHVRFGRLWGRLTPQARGFVSETARLYKVEAFLSPPEEGDETPAPVPGNPRLAPDQQMIDRIRAALVEAMRDPDEVRGPVEILARLFFWHMPPPAARKKILLGVTDLFCALGAFPDFYELARAGGDAGFEPGERPVINSLVLPYLHMRAETAEDGEAIVMLMEGFAETSDEWISTAALAWVTAEVARGRAAYLEAEQAEDLCAGFLDFVESRAGYWGRSPCIHLIETALALLVHTDLWSDEAAEEIRGRVLKIYGLSPNFWTRFDAAVAAGDLRPGGDLTEARRAFEEISGTLDRPAAAAPALGLFDRLEALDAERMRLDLFGPAGVVPVPGQPLQATLCREGRDAPESALRHLAFPGAAAPETGPAAEALAALARRAVRRRYRAGDRHSAPAYELQLETGRAAQALAERLQAGAAPGPGDPAAARLLRALMALSAGRHGYLGIGLSLTLLEAALRPAAGAPDEALAAEILAHLGRAVSRLPREDIAGLKSAAALQTALWGLTTRTPPEPVAARYVAAALALFPNIAAGLPEAPRPSEAGRALARSAMPVFDTLVVVFSCRPYLDSRIETLRRGWLATLAALGVPYIVVVGGGDGRIEGDVLHLEAPDDYEGLPQKTLKAVEWVYENTDFGHLYKIDDDCLLEASEFFHSLSYRKTDYYGRRIYRRVGDMDRLWHLSKSSSERGRFELDRSPEPSSYADGGSGYTLSRGAMRAVLQARAAPQNRPLIQSSFMEDKLIGDLLSTAEIAVREEDYFVSIRRRTHPEATPVALWANGFDPSAAAGTKLVHLDSTALQDPAMARRDQPVLRPHKIWPTFQTTRLGFNTNLLELVSGTAQLDRVREAPVSVLACMRNEMFMLPHFLAHYRRLGVESFLIADNCSDDGTLEFLAAQPDVAVFSVDTDYAASHYGVAWQQAMLANLRQGRWSLLADADELLVYPGWERRSLPALLRDAAFAEADAVRIFMLDMYPEGPLAAADFASGDPFAEAGFVDREPFLTNWQGRGPYSDSPTWTSALRHRLMPGSRPEIFVAQKIALLRYKPWMRLSAGLHYAAETRLAGQELLFAHFKYNAEFRRKARAEVRRRQHFNNAEEYGRYLAILSEGRDTIYDPRISVPWQDSPRVADLMRGGH